MRSSYSQHNLYTACPKRWQHEYFSKLRPIAENASLYFGSAVDAGIMALLEGKADYLNIFKDRWNKSYQFGKSTQIYDSEVVVYGNSDFDSDVLKDKDKDQLLLWAAELKLGEGPDGVEVFKEVLRTKKNPYKHTTTEQLKYFNRASWLSLKRKGELLIEAFKEQFLPRITKVHATQKYAKLDLPSGDTIAGFIDMILEIKGHDYPIIFDLKTAAQPYEQSQIELTEQLTLYAGFAAKEYNSDKVGYVVLCKQIQKETEAYCGSCGFQRKGKFKTCNNVINSNRCEGEWVEKKVLKPEVQVLIEKKSPEQIQDLLTDYSTIMLAMKNNIVYKNTSKCNSWYGAPCAFKNLCWKGDMKGLKKKDE